MKYSLTVLIPVLNGMPYIKAALASLEAQTFRDFKVLIWDNGSSDGSLEEAQQWIPSRIPGKVVSNHPLPLHDCLARMVEESETELCARLDADDICHPERLERQFRQFAGDPTLVVLGTQAEYINAYGELKGEKSNFPLTYSDILAGMLVENQILHPSIMFRRKTILDVGNYAVPKPCEDFDLWMKVAQKGKVLNLPDALVYYRIHTQSVIATARHANQLEESNLQCLENNTKPLFGISPLTYRKLRKKKHYCAMIPLIIAGLIISSRSQSSILSVLGSSRFLWSARCLTASCDLISRAVWWTFHRLGSLLS